MNATKMERQQNQRLKSYRPVADAGCLRGRGMVLFTIEESKSVLLWCFLVYICLQHGCCVLQKYWSLPAQSQHDNTCSPENLAQTHWMTIGVCTECFNHKEMIVILKASTNEGHGSQMFDLCVCFCFVFNIRSEFPPQLWPWFVFSEC